jgi:hypothetical protein
LTSRSVDARWGAVSRWRGGRFFREIGWFGLYLVLTLLMTWPWVLHLRDGVPDRLDFYGESCGIAWVFHQTFHDPTHLFQMPIMYPAKDAVTFGDACFSVCLPAFPFLAAGVNPITVRTILDLLGFAFCGYALFRLTRTLTGSAIAGFFAGTIFAFVPWRFDQISHLGHLTTGWLALVFEALVLFVRRRTWRRASWMGAVFAVNGLTSLYWLFQPLLALVVTLLFLAYVHRALRDPALWIRGAIAMAGAALLMLPLLLPFRAASENPRMTRSPMETLYFSAKPRDWLVASERNQLYGTETTWDANPERKLFPGFLPIVLAGIGALVVRRREDADFGLTDSGMKRFEPSRRLLHLLDGAAVIFGVLLLDDLATVPLDIPFRLSGMAKYFTLFSLAALSRFWFRLPNFLGGRSYGGIRDVLARSARPEIWLAGILVVIGFLQSLGLRFFLYWSLYNNLFFFRAMRVPARSALIAYIGLSVFAGAGAVCLISKVSARRRVIGLAVALTAAILFELHVAPLHLEAAEVEPPPVYETIRNLSMRGGLVELPVDAAYQKQYYVLRLMNHWKPLITAQSGFVSPQEVGIERLTATHPIPDRLMDLLESIPASYMIVHEDFLDAKDRDAIHDFVAREIETGRLRFLRRYRGSSHTDDLYAVTRTEPRAGPGQPLPFARPKYVAPAAPESPAALRWHLKRLRS